MKLNRNDSFKFECCSLLTATLKFDLQKLKKLIKMNFGFNACRVCLKPDTNGSFSSAFDSGGVIADQILFFFKVSVRNVFVCF